MSYYQSKYFKYKNKYLTLKRVMLGGDNETWNLDTDDINNEITTNFNLFFKPTRKYNKVLDIEINFDKTNTKEQANEILKKPIIYEQKIKYTSSSGSTDELCMTYVISLNFDFLQKLYRVYGEYRAIYSFNVRQDVCNNISSPDNFNHEEYYNYFKKIINENYKYDDYKNIYIAVVPGSMEEYYLPTCSQEFLDKNAEEKLLILIVGNQYTTPETSNYNVSVKEIYDTMKKYKNKYGKRIKIIHIYSLFYTNIRDKKGDAGYDYEKFKLIPMFTEFCLDISTNRKNKIIHIGLFVCGKIMQINYSENQSILDNFLMIGCDGARYREKILMKNCIYEINKTILSKTSMTEETLFHIVPCSEESKIKTEDIKTILKYDKL